jgi:hypothetical protein
MIGQEQNCSFFWISAVLCALATSTAVYAQPIQDATGNEWRQLTETTNLSWDEVSSVCPTDGETPCSGSVRDVELTGWVWGSAEQVVDFLAEFEPDLLTAEFSLLSGLEYFSSVSTVISAGFDHTYASAGTYHQSGGSRGNTSSLTEDGAPIRGVAGWGCGPCGGTLGVGASPAEVTSSDAATGAWLWRSTGPAPASPDAVSPALAGTCGDSDEDGVDDCEDNCSDAPNPGQDDTDGDGCGNVCDADYDQDGRVSFSDFGDFTSAFGSFDLVKDHSEPVTGPSGHSDFGVFSAAFGKAPGPSGTTAGTTACP